MRVLRSTLLGTGVALLWVGTCAHAAHRHRETNVDPVGVWNCVVFGHPAFGDERMYFSFAVDGSVQLAREIGDDVRPWEPLPDWSVEDDDMSFRDPHTGREFSADLSQPTLGGKWRTPTLLGSWWCTAMDSTVLAAPDPAKRLRPMPPLLPAMTATPAYPIQAIRDAKQGSAVTCFLVDASGAIVQPEIIELSDEVFRAPILTALSHSRYRGWDDSSVLRPGCRSYIFKLDARN